MSSLSRTPTCKPGLIDDYWSRRLKGGRDRDRTSNQPLRVIARTLENASTYKYIALADTVPMALLTTQASGATPCICLSLDLRPTSVTLSACPKANNLHVDTRQGHRICRPGVVGFTA